jgi:hypothetical protein
MTCPRCQQDNPAHARFCLGCGVRLSLACLQCGQAVAGSTAAPARSPAPETYELEIPPGRVGRRRRADLDLRHDLDGHADLRDPGDLT